MVDLISHDITKPFGPHFTEHWRADFIFNAASIASRKMYLEYPMETIATHIDGARNACAHALATDARLVSFSSFEVYGEPLVIPTPENYPGFVDILADRACYAESKRMAETICVTEHRKRGVKVVIARPFNIFGPGEYLLNGRVIPSIINAALTQQPFTIFGLGTHTRSYCYISDAVTQLLCLAVKGEAGQAYNVGNGKIEISLIALTDLASTIIQRHKNDRA